METLIIILTHNRSSLLEKCLSSIVPQLGKDDEVVVVNNNSTEEETEKIVGLVGKYKDKKIRYVFNESSSIPNGRNKGLKTVQKKAKIVVFIDDDCIADKDWLQHIKKEHRIHKDWQVIQGGVESIPKENLYVRVTSLFYQNWLKAIFLTENTLSTFDSKNVSFKVEVFKLGLRFSDQLNRSSDIELGHRLRGKGFRIGYSPNIQVYHQERTSFLPFIRQHLNIAKGEKEAGIKLLPLRYKYHLVSFGKLTGRLIKERQFLSIFLFWFLIPFILIIRMGVFLSRPWRCRS